MVWWIYLALGAAYWLFNLVASIRAVRTVPSLASIAPRESGPWPRVSHIVPACNEADQFATAVRSRLAEGYPDAEFILIDDRSTDATGQLADQLAATDPRVQVLHLTDLPAGWLGKVHALHQGTQLATGEWLLFSDADVHLAPGTLARALAFCDQHNLDHLAVFPDVWRGTWLLDVVMAMFVRIFGLAVRPHLIANPRSRAAIGVGAFNLVQRSALARTPGFAALRFDVVDDLALGQMLKQHGARGGVLNGRGFVGVKWYVSIPDMARGAEKSALASVAGFSLLRLTAFCCLLAALELSPFVCIFAFGQPAVQLAAAATIACALAAQVIPSVWFARPWWPALLIPLATMLAVFIMLRAGVLTILRGGMLWRGTLYPLATLRAGARLRFP